MKRERILPSDTPASLSSRMGVPLCMLLRRNELYSTAWLLPGREIDVPDGAFCLTASFPCPAAALMRGAAESLPEERDETSDECIPFKSATAEMAR